MQILYFGQGGETGYVDEAARNSHIARMSILKIAKMGHPVLSRIADPVADPTAPEIQALIRDMIVTMHDAGGAGLAAPQVHVPLRVVVYHAPAERSEDDEDDGHQSAPLTVLINPEIEPVGEETSSGWEGCLSIPGLRGEVTRASHIRYSALDASGERIKGEASGFHARVFQHECDHLNGLLYPQRMDDLGKLIFESEIRHLVEADEEAEEAAE